MRRRIRPLTLCVALLCLLAAHGAGAIRNAPSEIVTAIGDGDTLTTAGGTRVRLVQIDAPELGSGECYSRASRAALLRLVPVGSTVVLETDPRLDQVDRFGRLLRYVRRGTTNVNVALVRAGAAAPYFYDGDRGRYAERLLVEARRAKAAKRGLWGACPGTALDPYRSLDTRRSQSGGGGLGIVGGCDPSYRGACIPPPPPDLDCDDIRELGAAPVRVVGSDPHRLDGDDDGWGCE
jgi:endonuclease YncB( thermonuclease family)